MKPTTRKQWFSTGFTGGGGAKVDREKNAVIGAVVCRAGEAKGHGLWLDDEFIRSVHAGMTAKAGGMKARFGHPNMCSDALGTFIGRWKNPTISAPAGGSYRGAPDPVVECRADLFISSAAAESPSGDLRAYILEMAEKDADMCGASIVFDRDIDAEEAFTTANGGASFASPDPRNTTNLPHARLAAIHAADIVDDPAATDGIFTSRTGAAMAAQMTEWLDLHPEVFAALKDPEIVAALSAHGDQIEAFLARYEAHKAGSKTKEKEEIAMSGTTETPPNPAEPRGYCPACGAAVMEPATVDGSAKCINGHQFPDVDMKKDKPASEAAPDDATPPAVSASTPEQGTSALATQTPAEFEAMRSENVTLKEQLAASEAKCAALSKGVPPVSAASAADGLTPWQRAMSKAKK